MGMMDEAFSAYLEQSCPHCSLITYSLKEAGPLNCFLFVDPVEISETSTCFHAKAGDEKVPCFFFFLVSLSLSMLQSLLSCACAPVQDVTELQSVCVFAGMNAFDVSFSV